ncbi:MAG: hypothetical protein ACRDRO_07005 [Pseudonocardiaceae bacterium]
MTIVVNGHNVKVPEHYRVHVAEKTVHIARLRRSHDRRQVHHGHRTPTSIAEATGTLGLRTMATAPGRTLRP